MAAVKITMAILMVVPYFFLLYLGLSLYEKRVKWHLSIQDKLPICLCGSILLGMFTAIFTL